MGGGREVSIISHRPVTRSDLKQERSFFRGSVSTFLQLVVACGSSSLWGYCGTTQERHANRDARARDPNRGNRLLSCSLASRFACHSK